MAEATHEPRFRVGERVRVLDAYPPGHLRTPFYIRGCEGTIERLCGAFPNPEELAQGHFHELEVIQAAVLPLLFQFLSSQCS